MIIKFYSGQQLLETNKKIGTVTKEILKGLGDMELGGRVETIQTTSLLRMASILRRVLETCKNLLSLKLL